MPSKRDHRPKIKAKRQGAVRVPKLDYSNSNRNIKTLKSIEKAIQNEKEELK